MTFVNSLRESLSANQSPPVAGHWHAISLCLDDTACEFLNIGVAFVHGSHIEVRMLDTFERLECLYHKRFSADNKPSPGGVSMVSPNYQGVE